MKRLLIILGVIALGVIIAACAPQPACGEKYFEYQTGECCLDENANEVCDDDEKEVAEPTCEDECTEGSCSGSKYIACVTGSEGCKVEKAKEKVAGQCGIECVTSDDCESGFSCTAENKCEEGVELDCKTGCKLAEIVEQTYVDVDYSITIKNIDPECAITCRDESTNVKTSESLKLQPGEEGTLAMPNSQTFEYIAVVCVQEEAKDCPGKRQVFNPVSR